MSAKGMLHYYGERFRTVEINNTFYRMPSVSVLETWAGDVPADFKFVLKAPRQISHMKRLKDAADSVSYLLEAAWTLEERLGPLLFQQPPNLEKDVPRLRDFLALLPSKRRVAFEFRHQSWFDEEVFGLLRDHQAALCIAEAENDLEDPFVSTGDWGYLRLRRPDYDNAEIRKWVHLVRKRCNIMFMEGIPAGTKLPCLYASLTIPQECLHAISSPSIFRKRQGHDAQSLCRVPKRRFV
jgi:uncharacterized protein YecE (DUF72 family)